MIQVEQIKILRLVFFKKPLLNFLFLSGETCGQSSGYAAWISTAELGDLPLISQQSTFKGGAWLTVGSCAFHGMLAGNLAAFGVEAPVLLQTNCFPLISSMVFNNSKVHQWCT